MAGQLVEPPNLDRVIVLFCTAQQMEFEEVVDNLHLMMDKSVLLVKVIHVFAVRGAPGCGVCEVQRWVCICKSGEPMSMRVGSLRTICGQTCTDKKNMYGS